MQTLRRAPHLARFVLLWFVLSLGVAIASPVVNPQEMQMVCTGSGAMKLIISNAEGDQDTTLATMDCPLCVTGLVITPELPAFEFKPELRNNLAVIHPASVTNAQFFSAPLPARGPPSLY